MESKFLIFWAINGDLNVESLTNQLEEMHALGFTGVVFHPRYYTNNPPYLGAQYYELVSEIISYAQKLNMEFWIYDENGWPSGHASGKVMEKLGKCECKWISYEDGKIKINTYSEIDTFSDEAMKAFVEITYDGYKNGLTKEAFEYIKGFFSDEVGFLDGHGISMQKGGVPWSDSFEEEYRKKYGESLFDKLESLFVEKDGYQEIRKRFWEMAADKLANNYYRRINAWCERHNKRYTAHLKGEENIFFQISPSGSAYRNLIEINTPGVDALERYPGNSYYPRIASSLSRQFSDGVCMCESMGGSGWGLTPADFKNYINWLLECGINMFVFHISQYKKDAASIYDWPPDFPMGLNWKALFPQLLSELKNGSCKKDIHSRKVLVIAPSRGVMSEYVPLDAMKLNEHNGSGVPDTKAGRISNNFNRLVKHLSDRKMQFDVTEEWIVDKYGEIEGNSLRIGKQNYDCVIVGTGAIFENKKTISLLKEKRIAFDATLFLWKVIGAGKNQLMLCNERNRLPFKLKKCQKLVIISLERIESIDCMGTTLLPKEKNGQLTYEIDESLCKIAISKEVLEIDIVYSEKKKSIEERFTYLCGEFEVLNNDPYEDCDLRQQYSKCHFSIEEQNTERYREYANIDFISGGYPFMKNTVELRSLFYVGEEGLLTVMDEGALFADAAWIEIDGGQRRYIYKGQMTLDGVRRGLHRVSLGLIPSTFNTYGPHHYYRGDHYLISPDQYKGVKNFVDERGIEKNYREGMYFVKFGIKEWEND